VQTCSKSVAQTLRPSGSRLSRNTTKFLLEGVDMPLSFLRPTRRLSNLGQVVNRDLRAVAKIEAI
jgi:hypothetical protein